MSTAGHRPLHLLWLFHWAFLYNPDELPLGLPPVTTRSSMDIAGVSVSHSHLHPPALERFPPSAIPAAAAGTQAKVLHRQSLHRSAAGTWLLGIWPGATNRPRSLLRPTGKVHRGGPTGKVHRGRKQRPTGKVHRGGSQGRLPHGGGCLTFSRGAPVGPAQLCVQPLVLREVGLLSVPSPGGADLASYYRNGSCIVKVSCTRVRPHHRMKVLITVANCLQPHLHHPASISCGRESLVPGVIACGLVPCVARWRACYGPSQP